MRSIRWAAAAAAAAIGFGATVALAQDGSFPFRGGLAPFDFALIGDVPYNLAVGATAATSPNAALYDRLVEDINADPQIRFVMHSGDIKSGSERCSDELFADRFARYQQFSDPFIFTPGDNEWTDCHRVNNGQFQPLERLARLRQVFFPVPGLTLGQNPVQIESQNFQGFPENTRFVHRRVVFAALHYVGSANGLAAFDVNSSVVRTPADDEEVARRSAANLAWMHQTFNLAERLNSPGVLLMIQANPGLEFIPVPAERAGFESFLAQLEDRVQAFGKPVVLAHGDSHYFRVDKPRLDQAAFLPNFTRVENFGAANYHWVRVTVTPRSPDVFSFHPEIVPPPR